MDRRYISRQLTTIPLAAQVLPRAAAQSIRGSSSAYPYDVAGNVSSPVKIILVTLIFSMVFIAFFSLYIRKCLEASASGSRRPIVIANNHQSRQKFPSGLDRSVVDSFPVFLYSDVKVLKIGNGVLECAVCISEFSDNERLRFLPKCHHVFHPDCIDAWLAFHTTCPVCRADLAPDTLDGDSESNRESTQSQIGESGTEIGSENRYLSHVEEERVAPRFPRSHSTGHSLVSPGENCERYTLRLPEEIRKQINVGLKRTNSCVDLRRDGSSRRGGGVDGDGGRGGRRWSFHVTRTPGFIGKSEGHQSSSSTAFPV